MSGFPRVATDNITITTVTALSSSIGLAVTNHTGVTHSRGLAGRIFRFVERIMVVVIVPRRDKAAFIATNTASTNKHPLDNRRAFSLHVSGAIPNEDGGNQRTIGIDCYQRVGGIGYETRTTAILQNPPKD